MNSAIVPVRFIVGSRKLFEVPRRLQTVALRLEELIAGTVPDFGPADPESDGYRVLSAPEAALAAILARYPRHVMGGCQTYRRHYIDMASSYADYLGRFSGKTRSSLNRKRRKLAEQAGGTPDIEEFRAPEEVARFLAEAIPLSRRTYQARLLDAGLPEGEAAREETLALAAANRLRAYLLRLGGRAISYLFLPIQGETVCYAYLGYDPEFAQLSPGTVLQLEALERLFEERRYRYFDFTEGEGAHKAMFGTDAVSACSFFLLKPRAANRLLLRSLDSFDHGVSVAKRLAERCGALAGARRILRW